MTSRPEIKRNVSDISYADPTNVPSDIHVFLNGLDVTDWNWMWVDVEQGAGAKWIHRRGISTGRIDIVHGDFELKLPEDLVEGPAKERMSELEAEIERCWREIARLKADLLTFS